MSTHVGSTTEQLGGAFAEALARKDFDRMNEVLAEDIEFRALTPRRFWEAGSPEEAVSEVFTAWFGDSVRIDELVSVETGAVGDRGHVAYRFRGRNEDGPFVLEQQAYFTERDGRIAWMRVLCSGFRPA